MQAVNAEFRLNGSDFSAFIASKVGGRAELTNKQKAARLKKLGTSIEAVTAELREARKAAAIAAVEAEVAPAGEAA